MGVLYLCSWLYLPYVTYLVSYLRSVTSCHPRDIYHQLHQSTSHVLSVTSRHVFKVLKCPELSAAGDVAKPTWLFYPCSAPASFYSHNHACLIIACYYARITLRVTGDEVLFSDQQGRSIQCYGCFRAPYLPISRCRCTQGRSKDANRDREECFNGPDTWVTQLLRIDIGVSGELSRTRPDQSA